MTEFYDVIILGAGINGCAIARQLSQKGKKVIVLERDEIGCGISANSSKLIHGGLRYLENFQFGVVKESLKDRKRLYELYPDLVKMVPFYLPIYNNSPRPWWMIRIGLWLYDLFSRQPDYKCRRVTNAEYKQIFPEVREDDLQRIYMYYDGQTDDYALTCRITDDARQMGCIVKENSKVTEVNLGNEEIEVAYRENKKDHILKAPVLVNATGPWIDEVNEHYGLPHKFVISRVSGIHIVINKILVPDCMFLQNSDQRIFFMLPWKEGTTLIGTTERIEEQCCDDVVINEDDIDYLLNCANCYLEKPISRDDISATFLGIRPLVRKKTAIDATKMSRDYEIDLIRKGESTLIHVYGGKLTTCLSLAEKVERQIERF